MRAEIIDAVRKLEGLSAGDRVRVTLEGRSHVMTVTRTARRSDGAYGSIESTHVTVSFGPGRYATEVRAELLADGRQSLEPARREDDDN